MGLNGQTGQESPRSRQGYLLGAFLSIAETLKREYTAYSLLFEVSEKDKAEGLTHLFLRAGEDAGQGQYTDITKYRIHVMGYLLAANQDLSYKIDGNYLDQIPFIIEQYERHTGQTQGVIPPPKNREDNDMAILALKKAFLVHKAKRSDQDIPFIPNPRM